MPETSLFDLVLGAILVNNVIFARFLGICPYLGVSRSSGTALGMGLAVTFVMVLAAAITWPVQHLLLEPLELGYLQTIAFILVIASLVQLVEIVLKKLARGLYRALGIYLPLITTNCAILGVAILCIQKELSYLEALVFAVSSALGFTIAIVIFAGLREALSLRQVPARLAGVPIGLITAGILAMAFMGFAGLSGCAPSGAPSRLTAEFYAMGGIPVHVTAEGAEQEALEAAVAGYRAEVQRLEAELSVHRAGSALSRAARARGEPVAISPLAAELIEQALDLSAETDGAFDPTIGPLVQLWKRSLETGQVPADEAIEAARQSIGCDRVCLVTGSDPPTLALEPGSELDLGGIAKGAFADLGLAWLREAGIRRGLVELGGDLAVFDDRDAPPSFQLGIRHPRRPGGLLGTLRVDAGAVVTSGDYERSRWVSGRRYGHIIDPCTGWPAGSLRRSEAREGAVCSATVFAADAARADALATALVVLGADRGLKLIERIAGAEAVIATFGADASSKVDVIRSSGIGDRFLPAPP